jgi:hypothetical protein
MGSVVPLQVLAASLTVEVWLRRSGERAASPPGEILIQRGSILLYRDTEAIADFAMIRGRSIRLRDNAVRYEAVARKRPSAGQR